MGGEVRSTPKMTLNIVKWVIGAVQSEAVVYFILRSYDAIQQNEKKVLKSQLFDAERVDFTI